MTARALVRTVLLLGLVALVGWSRPAAAQTSGLPDFTADEFVAFYDQLDLPGTRPLTAAPRITGVPGADDRIVDLARLAGYQLRPVASVPLTATGGVLVQPAAAAPFDRLAAAAWAAGNPLVAVSEFRSVDEQREIFLAELRAEGRQRIGRPYTTSEIAIGSADAAIREVLRLHSVPGFSHHHSGHAVDVTVPGSGLGAFEGSAAQAWLAADNHANAKIHGFIPSYPEGATDIGPVPEPWQYVYVGVDRLRCAQDVIDLQDPDAPSRCPVGFLDRVSVDGTRVTVAGWAADPDVPTGPIDVHLYVDGQGAAIVRADDHRPDVAEQTPFGPNHGFRATLVLGQGTHEVCAYAINDRPGDANRLLGCRTVEVSTAEPVGSLDEVRPQGTALRIRGWAADPDLPERALDVHVYVDGVGYAVRADEYRSDLQAGTPFGGFHGFSLTVDVPAGGHTACAYAIAAQRGESNQLLGCASAAVLGDEPTGALDVVRTVGDETVRVQGWAVDAEVPDEALPVHVYANGRGVAVTTADRARSDVDRAYGVGRDHGFDARFGLDVGRHDVCAYAIAVQPGEPNVLLGCRTVTVVGERPVGVLDVLRLDGDAVLVAGWAADPDWPTTPIEVQVSIDGVPERLLADGYRPDVASATMFGPNHGFGVRRGLAPGPHEICVTALPADAGEVPTAFGCATLTVASAPGVIHLTFDDGPHPTWTPEVLDVLDRYGAAATFFPIGSAAEQQPGLVDEIAALGHTLGNQTYDHVRLTEVDLEEFTYQVETAEAAISPHGTQCLRPPYGAVDDTVRDRAAALGYEVVLWSVDTEDWRLPGADVIADRIVAGAEDGAVVLLHDGGDELRSQTVSGLDAALDRLTDEGWRFEPVC
ncbi:polysaccharide deacetylase family protein [Rhabdothermincola salaria]|uniref:polysaccharide deacetylase family protein n=1 Tax=Rhabdothermincola salaria TaxID=2903142 RepID=UPI001E5E2539|nr:polysaccharide deacetylase family protein [Rhabdothermincola salaria]MCD9622849.1 polysaccharide deacetylase family protein [Rhabdothermincola salaria]